MQQPPRVPEAVRTYYESFDERERLSDGLGRLELARTQEILLRRLPASPARLLDVGGAAGRYACWLARQGYAVHLVDPVARLVEQAREASRTQPETPLAGCTVGDARALDFDDAFADAILLFGPLYHLVERGDRLEALREAQRVLVPGGTLFAVGISRFASAIDGMARSFLDDPEFAKIVDRDLRDGQHRNPSGHPHYFTDAYFHRPQELVQEAEQAGFDSAELLAIDGLGWAIRDLDRRWSDAAAREGILALLRRLEAEPDLIGASPHLMCVARKPR